MLCPQVRKNEMVLFSSFGERSKNTVRISNCHLRTRRAGRQLFQYQCIPSVKYTLTFMVLQYRQACFIVFRHITTIS